MREKKFVLRKKTSKVGSGIRVSRGGERKGAGSNYLSLNFFTYSIRILNFHEKIGKKLGSKVDQP
jgi:hypothetical protein